MLTKFYATSRDKKVANMFAGLDGTSNHTQDPQELQPVILTIETTDDVEKPFADIGTLSELLFCIGTSFEVTECCRDDVVKDGRYG